MSKKIQFTDEPLREFRVVSDLLPSPEELAFREESVEVTITLSKKNIDFFKAEAGKHHTQYQRMIRQLIDAHVDSQERALTNRKSWWASQSCFSKMRSHTTLKQMSFFVAPGVLARRKKIGLPPFEREALSTMK